MKFKQSYMTGKIEFEYNKHKINQNAQKSIGLQFLRFDNMFQKWNFFSVNKLDRPLFINKILGISWGFQNINNFSLFFEEEIILQK